MTQCNCILTLVVVLVACNTYASAESKKGCGVAKASLNTKRSIISNGRLNIDISALERGIKRSLPDDGGEIDCDNAKKSSVEIKESAVSAIPGQNEELVTKVSEKNAKKSNVNKDSHEYLVLPVKKALGSIEKERKDKLEKPPKKHSPLWSLSKLIENTDVKGSKKANVVPQKTSLKIEKGSSKSNLATATDPANAIKATLSKAIEKVEKVIANKNANLIKTGDSRTKSSSSVSSKSNKSESSKAPTPAKMAAPAVPKDPYAEIALGPDRPKIPELKSDSGDQSPVMKMANGEMKPVSSGGSRGSSDPTVRDAKPLAGEHDVGGLLDRLTDKLNSGGGGVAMETSPLASDTNQVKYVQSPLTDEAGDKQAQEFAVDKLKDQADMSEVKKMTEQDGLYAGDTTEGTPAAASAAMNRDPQSTDDLTAALAKSQNSASASSSTSATDDLTAALAKSQGSSPESATDDLTAALAKSQGSSAESATDDLTAALAKSQGSSAESATSEGTESAESAAALAGAGSNGDDDGIAKSLSKASSLSSDAVMDILKSGKVAGSDFSNADVSTGPDPYANTAESQQSTQATDDSLSSLIGGSKSADSASEDSIGGNGGLDASSLSALMGSSKNAGATDETAYAGGLDSSDLTGGLGGMTDAGDSGLAGGASESDLASRSTEGTPTSDSDADSEFERNSIPATSDESYRNRYNTEIFKKHIIMRPKRDTYQSPFNSKEAFDTAI